MLLFVILPILMCGYIIQRLSKIRNFSLHTHDTQIVYFRTVWLGILSLSASLILLLSLNSLSQKFELTNPILNPNKIIIFLKESLGDFGITRASIPFFILLTLLAAILSVIYSIVFSNFFSTLRFFRKIKMNRQAKRIKKIKSLKRLKRLKNQHWKAKNSINIILLKNILCLLADFFSLLDYFRSAEAYSIHITLKTTKEKSPLKHLLIESQLQSITLMLHMSDRKVYIGRVQQVPLPHKVNGDNSEILFFPMQSGYRDKDTLKVSITTKYNIEDTISIILKESEIQSATTYKNKIFENFMQEQKNKEDENKQDAETKLSAIKDILKN